MAIELEAQDLLRWYQIDDEVRKITAACEDELHESIYVRYYERWQRRADCAVEAEWYAADLRRRRDRERWGPVIRHAPPPPPVSASGTIVPLFRPWSDFSASEKSGFLGLLR